MDNAERSLSKWVAFVGSREDCEAFARAKGNYQMTPERIEVLSAKRYILDIIDGLLPTDALYDAIHAAVDRNGGLDFDRTVSGDAVLKMAEEIRRIRTSPITAEQLATFKPAVPATSKKSRWA